MRLTRASALSIKPISWLWESRIPSGCVSLLEGDPGTSKSTLTLQMAAHISEGRPWPDGSPCPLGQAIICNAEDPEEEVILPRLIAAGARLANVSVIIPSQDRADDAFIIPDSVPALEEMIKDTGVKLVVFDPLEAFLSVHVNNYNNPHVRRALHSIEGLAKRTDCAVLIVRHLNKDAGKSPIYRGGGSIGIIGAARSAIIVSRDPTRGGHFLMMPNKLNWAARPSSLCYRTEEVRLANPADPAKPIKTSRVVWEGEAELSATDVFQPQADVSDESAVADAAGFIRRCLAEGPKLTSVIFHEARAEGVERKVLFQAAKLSGVLKRPEGTRGEWVWELPAEIETAFLEEAAQ